MSSPFQLTLADVKAKGLAALREGRLSAQGPEPTCRYRDHTGRACIVGAAIPDEVVGTFDHVRNCSRVSQLLDETFEVNLDELPAIQRLQDIHDRWAQLLNGAAAGPGSGCVNSSLEGLTVEQLKAKLEQELTS